MLSDLVDARVDEAAPTAAGTVVGTVTGVVAGSSVGPSAAPPPAALPVPAATRRRARVQPRTSVTILVFLVGVAAGILGLKVATPTRGSSIDAFPALDRTAAEPVQAGAVAHALARNDVHGLAQLLDPDTLTAIQTQLKPIIFYDSATFVGATTLGSDTLAGYIVRGRDDSGNLGIVGLTIRLRDGQVVAK